MKLNRRDAFCPCLWASSGDLDQFCFTNQRKLESAPLTVSRRNALQGSIAYFKNFRLQLTGGRYSVAHSLTKTFKIYHWYKTTAEMYYLLPKPTGLAHPPLTLQFGLHQVQFEINLKISTEQ